METDRWETTSIPLDQIPLSDVSLIKSDFSWTLKGTVTNNSKYDLGSVRFLVTIQDCPPSQTCRIVGQEDATTMSSDSFKKLLVPSGQVRLFKTYGMKFENMPPMANPRWDYRVTEIRAIRP